MIITFLKYIVVGLLGAFIHISSIILLVELFAVSPVIATIIGFIPTVIVAYLLNYGWTFKGNNNHHHQAMTRYIIVTLFGLFLNTFVVYITTEILHWWYIYGIITMVIVVTLSNFSLNFLWSFRKQSAVH